MNFSFTTVLNEPNRNNDIQVNVTLKDDSRFVIASIFCIATQSELIVEPWMASQVCDAYAELLKSEEKTERFCRSEDRYHARLA